MNRLKKQAGWVFPAAAIVAVCLLFPSCTSFSFAGQKSCQVPQDFFGISPERSLLEKEDVDLLNTFNAVWIRTTIKWADVEPEEGTWDFEPWDYYLEQAEAAKKKVVFVLGYDNGWLFKDNKERNKVTEAEIPYFLTYVEKVVSRYHTRVIYEIWNEPNDAFWKGTNEQFYTLVSATIKTIRYAEPKAVILAGSTYRVSKSFTRGLFKSGAMEDADGFSLHPFATNPKASIKQYNKLRKIVNEFDFYKPVWITQVGYFTGPYPFFTTKRYAENIVKTLSGFAAKSGEIRNVIWYELTEEQSNTEEDKSLKPMSYMGLIYPDKTLKPGAEAFMLTAEHLAGATHNPRIPLREGVGKKVTSLYFKKANGSSVLILWNDAWKKATFQLAVADAKNITHHNIHNRETTPLTDELILEIGKEPVFITWDGGETPRLWVYVPPPPPEEEPLLEQE
jgi:hypothetical protein